MKIRHLILLVPFLIISEPAHCKDNGRAYQIRLDKEGWGNGSPNDIEAVLYSACDSIHEHFAPLKEKEPIRVSRDKSGPITLFQRNIRGEIIVKINTGDRYWCQYSYQIAHEFCHVLCRFRNGSRRNLWFEESLCEMASMFALRSMAKTWKTAPPYPNWKSYSALIRDYVKDLETKHALPEGLSLADYYSMHSEKFEKDAVNRTMNGKIAGALLIAFETNPEHWPSILYINKGKAKEDIPFSEYLKNWLNQAPKKHHIFIHSLARQFGISL